MQKFVIVVTVAILAAMVQGGTIGDHSNPLESTGNALHRLEIDVKKILEKVNKTLTAAQNEVEKTADAAEKKAVSLMKNVEKKVQDELDELKKKAADAGANIDDCFDGNEEKLVNLPNVFVDQIIHCFSDSAVKGFQSLQQVLNDVQQLVDDLDTIKQEFEECKQQENKSQCLMDIVMKISQEKKELIKIETDAEAVALFFSKLNIKIVTCLTTKVADYESELKQITDEISTCIINKIHH